MRRGRRWVALVAAGVVVLAAGCGTKHAASGPPARIALVVPSTGFNVSQELGGGFLAGARSVGGVEATVTGPADYDGAKQLSMFQDTTNSAKGGITVFAQSPELFARPMAAAEGKGIPLIAVDIRPDPTSHVKLYVGNDDRLLGQMLADEVVKRLPADASGKVVLGTRSPGVPALDDRAAGITAEFARKLPKVQVVGPIDVQRDDAANVAAWRTVVAANPDALAFLGVDASFNLSAVHASTRGSWLAGGFDLEPKSLQAVRDGDLAVVISPEHYLAGWLAGLLQARHAKDGTALPSGWLAIPGIAVTGDNVDEIVKREASDGSREAWFGAQIAKMTADLKPYLRPLT